METKNETKSLDDSTLSYSQMKSSLDHLLEIEIKPSTGIYEMSQYLISLIEKMEWLDSLGDETIELYIEDIEDRIEKISKHYTPILSGINKHYIENMDPSVLKKIREDDVKFKHLLHGAKLVCDGVKAHYFNIDDVFE